MFRGLESFPWVELARPEMCTFPPQFDVSRAYRGLPIC